MTVAKPNRHVISVVVADRVGILRDITSVVADLGGNIDGITQTVVEGYFTVTLTATFPARLTAEAIRAAVHERFPPKDASVSVMAYDFRAVATPSGPGTRYVVTVNGPDKPAILKAITAFFSDKHINIEDWFVRFSGDCVTHLGEVTVPAVLDIQQVQDEFRQLLAERSQQCSFQNINIFRAMHEIGPIKSLLSEEHRAR